MICARCRAALHLDPSWPVPKEHALSMQSAPTLGQLPSLRPGGPKSAVDPNEVVRRAVVAACEDVGVDVAFGAHPLCADCVHQVRGDMERLLSMLRVENTAYQSFLDAALPARHAPAASSSDLSTSAAADPLDDGCEEQQLLAELASMQQRAEVVRADIQRLNTQRRKLELMKEAYWRRENVLQTQLAVFNTERSVVIARGDRARSELAQLKTTSIYNDLFHIWFENHFATVNGLRLGRLPSQPVDWAEINAVLGLTVLLVHRLGARLGVSFSQFAPLPSGSTSRMVKVDDRSEYELYSSHDVSLGKFFWSRRFDTALEGLLRCIAELVAATEGRSDAHIRPPYPIKGDKIGGISIRYQFNDDELWTRAAKFMLTNLKWLIAIEGHLRSKAAAESAERSRSTTTSL